MVSYKFNYAMSFITIWTFIGLFVGACQNVDTKAVEKTAIDSGKQLAASYCSDAFKPMRENLISTAREKYPQFPSFDICPLINSAHFENVDTHK